MKLSEAELEIMEQIWKLGRPVTAGELAQPLQQKGWKPTTLLTFLARMVAKGALQVEKRGKQNHYTACVTGEQYRAAEAQEMLTRLYSGNVKRMIAALYDGNALSGDQLDELRDWLEGR